MSAAVAAVSGGGVPAWVGFAVGVLVVLGTMRSVVGVLIVPRAQRSWLTSAVDTTVREGFVHAAAPLRDYDDRDRFLGLMAPTYLLTLLGVWLVGLVLGYALIFWPLVGTLPTAFAFAGSSLFTLGFASADAAAPQAVVFSAAATGLLVVALQISYLPVLYNAFNRRERLVTLLESRAGAPAWGPEILARHVLVDIVDNLAPLYAEWERWAADVAESHSTYPVLLYFRSPNPLRNWVVALLAVLDCAALHMSLFPLSAPSECRLVLRMGFTCLREVATPLGIAFDPDPRPQDPIQLTEDEFAAAVRHLEDANWLPERTLEDAWAHFRGWRVNYERLAWAIADRVEAPPAPWAGPRRHLAGARTALPQRPTDRRPDAVDGRAELLRQAQARRAARPPSGQPLASLTTTTSAAEPGAAGADQEAVEK